MVTLCTPCLFNMDALYIYIYIYIYVCVCARARAYTHLQSVFKCLVWISELTAIISLYGIRWSPAIQSIHTPHTNSVRSSFIFHYMFRPWILTLIRWIQVQEEKCYRIGLPFAVSLLKYTRYCVPPPPQKKRIKRTVKHEKSIKLSIKFVLNPECRKWSRGCVFILHFCCVDCVC